MNIQYIVNTYVVLENVLETSGGTTPQNLGSDESKSFAIFSEICANQIRIRIPNKKKRICGSIKKDLC
jgi:uncharacterized membrane protein